MKYNRKFYISFAMVSEQTIGDIFKKNWYSFTSLFGLALRS